MPTAFQSFMSLAEITVPGLPLGSYKIYAAASARLYHAPFGSKPPQWEYSNYRGILVFGRKISTDSNPLAAGAASALDDAYWFRLLVSKSGEMKTVWQFKVFTDLNYQIDKPYFHVIHGLTRQYGFVFDDDDAAANFADQVQVNYIPPLSPEKLLSSKSLSRRGTSKTHPGKLTSNKSQTSPIAVTAPVGDSFRRIIGLKRFGTYGGRSANVSKLVRRVIPNTILGVDRGPQDRDFNNSEMFADEFSFPERVPTLR
ncbi:hypothetical protein AX14_006807 [Amanita brunnescens Koide BX004]|nr:hypothetical protein AX14_006807 [Amanita brunnescens Koide BX004]